MNTVIIPVKNISICKNSTRTTSNEQNLQELTDSISENGLLQPITVAKEPKKKNHYYVVMGRRRLTACKMAGLTEISCIVTEADAKGQLLMEIQENINRENLGILDEAAIVATLVDSDGILQAASLLSKSSSWVLTRLAVSKVDPRFKEAYTAKRITLRGLLEISSASEERIARLHQIMDENTTGPIDIRATEVSLDWAEFDLADETLDPEKGSCHTCRFNSSVNSLFSEFAGRCTLMACFDNKNLVSKQRKQEAWLASGKQIIGIAMHTLNISDEVYEKYKEQILLVPNVYSIRGLYLTTDEDGSYEDKYKAALENDPTLTEMMKFDGSMVLLTKDVLDQYLEEIKAGPNDRSSKSSGTATYDDSDNNHNDAQKVIAFEIAKKKANLKKYLDNEPNRFVEFAADTMKEHINEMELHIFADKIGLIVSDEPVLQLLRSACIAEAGYQKEGVPELARILKGLREILHKGGNRLVYNKEAESFLATEEPEKLSAYRAMCEEKAAKRQKGCDEAVAKLERQLERLSSTTDNGLDEELKNEMQGEEDDDDFEND